MLELVQSHRLARLTLLFPFFTQSACQAPLFLYYLLFFFSFPSYAPFLLALYHLCFSFFISLENALCSPSPLPLAFQVTPLIVAFQDVSRVHEHRM